MPRGKELEQLPKSNTVIGMGQERSKYNRGTIVTGEQSHPARVENSKKQ